MGTGLSAVVLSLFLAQAPPSTMAQWQAKWLVAGPNGLTAGTIALVRNPSAPQYHQFDDSRNLCISDLRYIAAYGPPAERNDAFQSAEHLLFLYSAIGVDP